MNYTWSPDYRTGAGTPFTVEDVSSEDCPKAAVTRDSLDWLNLRYKAKSLGQMGIPLFKPGAISAREVDALMAIELEDRKFEQARDEALELERRSGSD